ncbi:Rieske (2Fe-2S) protein [Neobacillus terrae]|uniref:Rieske (2Fe-2S) protein n=1 Tax=Neobacillus terrae TaxID=3034837 RepID=UPI00140B4F27|nr:Rieske (2Fe-2S) protein [Neobacillus terrae]NHM32888.1 Rieske (2Fe-2S) protein [Neobacillus terrae]
MKHPVCMEEELQSGEMKSLKIDRIPVVVIRSKEGELFALRDVCPHKGPALSDGSLDGTCTANEPGEYNFVKDGEILKCPWHSWEFDIRTGCSLFDPHNVRVKTYEVTEEDGKVFVHL